ncbi:CoA ester lyase [bacterium LRH843]|nr:CoA ester lyase [bacterium LRH843]
MNRSRSYLFVPATNRSMLEKAVFSKADNAIFDLEDAVAYSEKQNAREIIKEGLLYLRDTKPIFIRINDVSTSFWEEDLTYAVTYGAAGVIVPKAESTQGIRLVCQKIEELVEQKKESNMVKNFQVIPLIETAKGIQFAYEIASADEMITRLAFGSIDFSLDINCELTAGGLELLYARSQLVIASRAAHIGAPIDSVYPDLNNLTGLTNETKLAKQIGFGAKLIIHPKQIEPVHTVFSPSHQEIEEAENIVTEFEKAEKQGAASISVGNKLVDYPIYKKAKELLAIVNK